MAASRTDQTPRPDDAAVHRAPKRPTTAQLQELGEIAMNCLVQVTRIMNVERHFVAAWAIDDGPRIQSALDQLEADLGIANDPEFRRWLLWLNDEVGESIAVCETRVCDSYHHAALRLGSEILHCWPRGTAGAAVGGGDSGRVDVFVDQLRIRKLRLSKPDCFGLSAKLRNERRRAERKLRDDARHARGLLPEEQEIVDILWKAGKPMLGKEIRGRLGNPHMSETDLKGLLSRLRRLNAIGNDRRRGGYYLPEV